MDQLQQFRVDWIWPLVLGGGGVLLAYDLLWLFVRQPLKRDHAAACLVVGMASAGAGMAIGQGWDDGVGYWVAFTVGLAALAGVLTLTAAILLLETWHGR